MAVPSRTSRVGVRLGSRMTIAQISLNGEALVDKRSSRLQVIGVPQSLAFDQLACVRIECEAAARPSSSVGQSGGVLSRASGVRVPPGAPFEGLIDERTKSRDPLLHPVQVPDAGQLAGAGTANDVRPG